MHAIQLPDGRRLTFEEFGDPAGLPTFFFHGTPSSSRIARLLDRSALEGHLRLIALNRPGMGGSSFQARRRMNQWPGDVAWTADRLSIPRFCVCGHSGGAPYALACASSLADRVACAALLGGALPQEVASRAALSAPARSTLRQFERPKYRRALIAGCGWIASRLWLKTLVEHSAAGLPPSDLAFFRSPGVADIFAADLRAALRGAGRGAAQDHWLVGEPSGIDVKAISCPVSIWYGEADPIAHPDFGPALRCAIDGSELYVRPGLGHISLFTVFRDVAAWLTKTARFR